MIIASPCPFVVKILTVLLLLIILLDGFVVVIIMLLLLMLLLIFMFNMLQLLIDRFCYVAVIISAMVNPNLISYVAVAIIFGNFVADINVVNI